MLHKLTNTWQKRFAGQGVNLCNLSTGAAVNDDAVNDILNAKEKGKQAFLDFISDRLASGRSSKFFDTLPRFKLKSFNTHVQKKLLQKRKK